MTDVEIDDALYSRQRYVLGDGAMQRMAKSSVLLCGLGGVGMEIAKNVILAGVKCLTIQDHRISSFADLGSQFFLREEDVKKNLKRVDACRDRLAELNPYVTIDTKTDALDMTSDLTYLLKYQCVVLTECSLELQLCVDQFCRTQDPPIQFITADVYGAFASLFCDFGNEFEVFDQNGEDVKDIFVHSITNANPGIVTCLENRMHGFETGDTVTFKEVNGMTPLNGKYCEIEVLSPYSFAICDTESFPPHLRGGICSQVKIPSQCSFRSLEAELQQPSLTTVDFSKLSAPSNIHLGFQALHMFIKEVGRLPATRCAIDAAEFVAFAHKINSAMIAKVNDVDEELLQWLSFTAQGCLTPLCAAIGGIAAQEVIKAVTGKFSPLKQWLLMDAAEVLKGTENDELGMFELKNDRYDTLRICVGESLLQKLASLKLFMVGCGAIGCEMLKNYALLGLGSSGMITITDNDIIEKSNLNRQFLFRPHHIRQPKSTTAATSTQDINAAIKLDAHQHKVCPQTENTVYTDEFFTDQDIVVNALDNLEARRYVDSRCVSNVKPLLESGTMGAKGHVQVIVPHLTESYSSQQDPADLDVPYCTLKSFPAQIEHCIQWARDKFESSFVQKPNLFNKFWTDNSDPSSVIQILKEGRPLEGAFQTARVMKNRLKSWSDCVVLARLKFNKYFNHRAKHLLHSFPLDTKLQDGTPFWSSPRRPPTPIEFDIDNRVHLNFIVACARLFAHANKVAYSENDTCKDNIVKLANISVPEFQPRNKKIVTDESAKKPEAPDTIEDEGGEAAATIHKSLQAVPLSPMAAIEFEKDDDSNGHIDFIAAASNLRAAMYNIESVDRLKAKKIAGRIVPAIATTTAAVAGLVTIELLKILKGAPFEHYKNCFMNLALPVCVFSEPGAAEKTTLSNGLSYTLWDRWELHGHKDLTLKQFIDAIKQKYKLDVSIVVHKLKMIYVPMMPAHKKRLPQTMIKLIKAPSDLQYVDLQIGYTSSGDEDEDGPPVRYYFYS